MRAEGKTIKSFIRATPPPFREVATKSICTLKLQQNKIEQAAYRLKERDKVLFQSCITAIKANKKERAAICANEVAEIRKIIKFLRNVQLAIERVVLRLETIRELSDIVVDLKPALRLLQSVSQELFEVLPDVSSELSNVNAAISETLYSTRITADESIIPVDRKTPGGQEILKEVTGFLEQKLTENLPEPPTTSQTPEAERTTIRELIALSESCSQVMGEESTDETDGDSSQTLFSIKKAQIQEISLKVEKPSLEDVLFDYVKKSNGEIDLTRCSDELKTSNEEIQKALESLGAKGKVRIEVKSG